MTGPTGLVGMAVLTGVAVGGVEVAVALAVGVLVRVGVRVGVCRRVKPSEVAVGGMGVGTFGLA